MPSDDTYLTIKAPAEGLCREKMSKFIAFAHPVSSADEAMDVVAAYRKKYHDARHVCWAYMVGPERSKFLSNDNGEPSGTAGKPILGQINSLGLTDVVVVVVRYFGGITLGTSGLIAAYREAAREALTAAEIVERYVMLPLSFSYPYIVMNDVMKTVRQPGVEVTSQTFDNMCEMTISARASLLPAISAKLSDIDSLTINS